MPKKKDKNTKFEKVSASSKGNKNACSLKTDELKAEAYRQYCEHIAKGYPKASWCFEHPTLTPTWESMESYIKADPTNPVFDTLKRKAAMAKNMAHWFGVLGSSANGSNPKASTASLQVIMRNIHGWDKENKVSEESPEASDSALQIIKPKDPT